MIILRVPGPEAKDSFIRLFVPMIVTPLNPCDDHRTLPVKHKPDLPEFFCGTDRNTLSHAEGCDTADGQEANARHEARAGCPCST
jgi:hypothetical protein